MHARDTVGATSERTGTRRPPVPVSAQRAPAATAGPGALLALQRSAGNSAVVQLLRDADHAGHRHDPAGGTCADEMAAVQRSAVHGVLGGAGRPLAEPVRAEMEARLGADFSDVRVHDDSAARASAVGIGARAYTSGSHVVIGPGGGDKHTLAHELTHVIQQRQGPVAGTATADGLSVSDPSDRFERAAEENARRVLAGPAPDTGARQGTGEAAVRTQSATGSVQRFADVAVPKLGTLRISNSGAFAISNGRPYIWVREDALGTISPALVDEGKQTQIGDATYHRYSLGGKVLNQCLHVAEEIINNRVRDLEHGTDASLIDTYSKKHGERAEHFGAPSDGTNRRMAKEFVRARNEAADPGVGQAFVIVALKPGDREMSQFHAAAVVARDGDDCVTLEAFAGATERLEPAASRMYTVNGGANSFHGFWTADEMYYHGVSATTVVIRPAL
ncbi:DUF4157 domain-containing protein [Streptomyces asoensis]|uniref:DUF4157 domain-containing protein n=1 Tax=Streptomyces asoensis TaxID=249586 RepID=A0A6M4WYK9_9ACTN|nr:DUF4157 domain-containing protein [Streptomyces asoensis]QJT01283.1 DUF4157 domain-containing protein [Streptomyces asoensis]